MLIHKIVQPIVVTTGWRPTQNWSNLKLRGAKCGLFSNKKFFTFQFMTFINRSFHLLYAFSTSLIDMHNFCKLDESQNEIK